MCTSCIDFGGQEQLGLIDFECPPCVLTQDKNKIYVRQLILLL